MGPDREGTGGRGEFREEGDETVDTPHLNRVEGFSCPSDAPIYPMRTVVKLTSVEAHRIRFWESRYRLVSPGRDESGRRLYSGNDIEQIRRIGEMVDKHGMSLPAVRRLLSERAA